jgi:large subunit ribosomal protein L22
MEITAKARFIRMSPRKVRLVIDVIRGMDIASARQQLRFMKKAAAEPVTKLLNSAVANAEHNFKLSPETLYVKAIAADGGPALKRWTPKAFGRAAPIKKRMTHLSIVLAERAAKGTKAAKGAKGTKAAK